MKLKDRLEWLRIICHTGIHELEQEVYGKNWQMWYLAKAIICTIFGITKTGSYIFIGTVPVATKDFKKTYHWDYGAGADWTELGVAQEGWFVVEYGNGYP